MRYNLLYTVIILFLLCARQQISFAQCPTLYDGLGNATNNPVWISCSGGNYTLYLQSPDNVGTFTVDYGDGSAIVSGGSLIPPAFISHTYAATIDTFILTFTETSSGCVITGLVVMEEPVNASIQIPIGGVTAACAPAALSFINSSTNASPTTTFIWDFGDGSPPQAYNWTNAGQTVSHTYLPGTVNCQTQVTLTAQNYCSGATPTIATFNPIQIWDIDDAEINASAAVLCYPDTIATFRNVTNKNCLGQGNTFQRYEYWNFGDYWGLGYDSIVPWQPFDPPTRPGYTIAFPGIGSYTIMMIDSNYCGQDTAFITVNIIPPPTAGVAGPDTICAGDPAVFNNLSTGGANAFSWNFGDGSGWNNTGGGNQTHIFNTAGSYTITIAANIAGGSNSCADTITTTIFVLPIPRAIFIMNDDRGCDSLTVSFTNASIDAIGWAWTFGNGNISNFQHPTSQFYNAVGTYDVSLTVTSLNGCDHTMTDQVYIFQTPVASFVPTNVCEDDLGSFISTSTSSSGDPLISWYWNFGDGDTSNQQNPTHIYSSTGVYNVIHLVSTANCSGTDTIPVTAFQKPTAAFSSSIINGCSPVSVSFNNSSTNADTYVWNFGDGTTSAEVNPNHVFVNNTTSNQNFNVMLISRTSSGCSDTAYSTITVYAIPNAAFSSNATPSCAPMPVNFNNLSSGANSYQWSFGDGTASTQTNPFHLYTNQTLFIQNYTITLVVQSSFGCSDTLSQGIVIYPEPQFSFNSVPDSGCSPLNVMFPSVIGAVVYNWDFGDGTTGSGATPTHTYYNSTTNDLDYIVRLIATNPFGCTDTSYGQVKVNPNPNALFNVLTTASCQPFNASFLNISTGGTNYFWDFGDGTTSNSNNSTIQHTYNHNSINSQVYNVSLIVQTDVGCTDTIIHQVTVYPTITADFTHDTAGCSPFIAEFLNQSQGEQDYNWNFGDGFNDVIENPNHTFINNTGNDTNYQVRLIVTSVYGCKDTIVKSVIVHPTPIAAFTSTPVTQLYPAATVNNVNNTSAGNWSYSWNFGDSLTSILSNPGSHTYSTWGNYTISLIVKSNYCSDTVTQNIVIVPPVPIAAFNGKKSGCKPVTVQFSNKSVYATSFNWDFGDGGVSSQENPEYTYYMPGVYTITMKASGEGGETTTIHIDSVIVYETPTAYFVSNPKTVFIPNEPVIVYNLSANANTYLWSFGDGETSLETSPEHYYKLEGEYTITLIASNNSGCVDTFEILNAVRAEENGDLIVPNAFTPNPNGSSGGLINPGAFDNDVFHPLTNGVVEYRLGIFNRWGELIFESFDLKIGWDGYYRGALCKQDVYIWKIWAKFSEGKEITKTGDVLLLR